jgi:hypothetical protein
VTLLRSTYKITKSSGPSPFLIIIPIGITRYNLGGPRNVNIYNQTITLTYVFKSRDYKIHVKITHFISILIISLTNFNAQFFIQ